jgi:hypothetical protein
MQCVEVLKCQLHFWSLHFDTSTPHKLTYLTLQGHAILIEVQCKMRCIEFPSLFFSEFRILESDSNFLIFQQRNSKKKRLESSESKMESDFRFGWGSQKLEPKIGIPNQVYCLLGTAPIGLC